MGSHCTTLEPCTLYSSDEKLCLKWNDFQANISSVFGTLRDDSDFADVTLVCEDGQQVEAHKVILASSSPFFLKLLKRNKHPHPMIFMRGLQSEDLVAIVDFIYFGEANVYQENLDSLLAVAEELQLKGLMGSGAEEKVKKINTPTTAKIPPNPGQQQPIIKKEYPTPDKSSSEAKEESSPPLEGTVAVTDYTVATELQDLDAKINSMMEVSKNKNDGNTAGLKRICNVCGKEGEQSNISRHVEATHITGVSHTCKICVTTKKTRHAIRRHTRQHK